MVRRLLLSFLTLTVLLIFSSSSIAQPNIPNIRLNKIAEGFTSPVFVTGARDGTNRLFVVEQAGIIRVLKPGEAGPGRLFLDIRDRVESGGEMGLLSVAFHPKFRENGRFFVNYTTRKRKLYTRISEFQVRPGSDGPAELSEIVWLAFEQPYENHNGGLNLFGPDGYLYIGTGDGGSANDPHYNGQRLDTLLGKMLRVSVDGTDPGKGFAIPKDNPFIGMPGVLPQIYAYGLRNPWRFSFDRQTGQLWAGDVGQDHREEIDLIVKGGNYGWRPMEGAICTPGVNPNCDTKGFALPVLDYERKDGGSVTGGYVYRGKNFPALNGVYIYGDFVSGNLWGLRFEGGRIAVQKKFAVTGLNISSFGEDDQGEVYLVDYSGGIYRIGL